MSYTISSIINGTRRQVLGGKKQGYIYQLVSQSGSVFTIGPQGTTWVINDTSVYPNLLAAINATTVAAAGYGSPWTIYIAQNGTWVPIYNVSDLPVNQNIPVAIAYIATNRNGTTTTSWWYINLSISNGTSFPVQVYLKPLATPPSTTDSSYQFYISTYDNVLVESYNVLASSDLAASREMVLLDFGNYPNLTVTTNKLCSPISVQTYEGYEISQTELFLTENRTNIDIAKESGNLKPNLIVKKSFNGSNAHIVQFNDIYWFISKESGISAASLEDINKIAISNGYAKMYPLRNAINCPNDINQSSVCGVIPINKQQIELYYNSHISPKQR